MRAVGMVLRAQLRQHVKSWLARTVKLVAGRMPDQSDPGETLASASFADDSAVRVGSVIQILEPTPAQISQAAAQNRPPSPAQLSWPGCRGTTCG
jgi:hypothetical protein